MADFEAVPPLVVIAGFSGRSLAQSAERAGFRVRVVDGFLDRDTRQVMARSRQREGLPESAFFGEPEPDWNRIAERAASIPEGVIVPTGGIENHLDLLERWHRRDRGNGARFCAAATSRAMHRVRDPEWLAECLSNTLLRWPRTRGTRPDGTGFDTRPGPLNETQSERWLKKPRFSGGGQGVRLCEGNPVEPTRDSAHVMQRFVAGKSGSAGFLARDDQVELLGVSWQLQGPEYGAPQEFGYVGNITWQSVPEEVATVLRQAAEEVARRAALVGLFGIDFIQDRHNRLWAVEVNPRWTASLELYERRSGRSLLRDHLAAFGCGEPVLSACQDLPTRSNREDSSMAGCWGKWTIYADSPAVARDLEDSLPIWDEFELGELADVPMPGTTFAVGDPVCTVLASGVNEDDCLDRLRCRADQVRPQLLEPC